MFFLFRYFFFFCVCNHYFRCVDLVQKICSAFLFIRNRSYVYFKQIVLYYILVGLLDDWEKMLNSRVKSIQCTEYATFMVLFFVIFSKFQKHRRRWKIEFFLRINNTHKNRKTFRPNTTSKIYRFSYNMNV